MKLKIRIYVLVIFIIAVSCYKETVVFDSEPNAGLHLSSLINLDGKDAFLDSELKMIRFPVSRNSLANFSAYTAFNGNSQVWFEEIKLNNNQVNEFGNLEFGKSYSLKIKYDGVHREFEFVFTNLPVFQIITDTKIWGEPKSLARIVISEPVNTSSWSSFAGVEYRGQSSRYLDKKSIGFSLWENITNTTKYSSGLLDYKPNSDWILNSAAVDPSGIRNLVSFEIWNSLDSEESGGEAKHLGIDMRIAELFINNRCQGFFIFSETINQQLLNAAPGDVLFKAINWADGATSFEGYNPEVPRGCIWNGWEQIIPDCKDVLQWGPLVNLYEIAIDSDDSTFKQNIFRNIDADNLIDYFLFLNLTFAGDNTGKNVFLYRKTNTGLFQIIPWDLDATWGISFDGSPQGYEGILTNALYQRLFETNPEDFISRVKQRWNELRDSQLKESELKHHFLYHFKELQESGIIDVENCNWGKNINLQNEQVYIETWMTNRLNYLDYFFSTME